MDRQIMFALSRCYWRCQVLKKENLIRLSKLPCGSSCGRAISSDTRRSTAAQSELDSTGRLGGLGRSFSTSDVHPAKVTSSEKEQKSQGATASKGASSSDSKKSIRGKNKAKISASKEDEEKAAEAKRLDRIRLDPAFNSQSTMLANRLLESLPHPPRPRIVRKPGLLKMGDDNERNMEPDPEYQGDDMTSSAHGELDAHREKRHYARLATWDMPLLYQFAQKFEPPTSTQILRFRYTSYLGESHPAEKKVVCQFTTQDVARVKELSEAHRTKLIKLVGTRYNPETDIVKMSCDLFQTQALNKQHLKDTIEKLVVEAKDETDLFEDVPLDFRHHKVKVRHEFPDDWKMSSDRQDQLLNSWASSRKEEAQRISKGQIVNGNDVVAAVMTGPPKLSAPASRKNAAT